MATLLFIAVPCANAQEPFASFDRASEEVLGDPHDLTIGPDGLLYITDKLGGRIVKMDPETLQVRGSFGGGDLLQVRDVSFGPDGRAYVAVTDLNTIVVYGFENEAPKLEAASTGFPRTEGVLAHSNGRIYVMASGTGQLIAIENGEVIAAAGGLYGAHDVVEYIDGTVWVADNGRSQLVQFTEDLETLRTLGGPQFGFIGPRYLDKDDFGRLVVADQDAHSVLLIDPVTEELLGVLGDGLPGKGPMKFDDPEGVAVRGSTYFVSDSDNNRVVKYVVVTN